MTPVLIGLLLAIGLALAVVGVVAYPHLREGSPLLTPEGERLAREARRKAREKARALTGSAANALSKGNGSTGVGGGPVAGGHGGGPAAGGPGGGPAAGRPDAVPPIGNTTVVWASPPQQVRSDQAAPQPGAGRSDRDDGSQSVPTTR